MGSVFFDYVIVMISTAIYYLYLKLKERKMITTIKLSLIKHVLGCNRFINLYVQVMDHI